MSADVARAFVDTNVLVYAHDTTSGAKRERALDLVGGLWRSQTGCLSIQVLQEFFVTVTRRIPARVDCATAAAAVADFAKWTTHAPASADVLSAIDVHARHRISFWDAMIVHSAASLGCDVLYTEDLSAGQRLESVLVVNPFV